MMFSFREFIKRGFLNAVGKLADYRIILNAAGWYDKGVLLEEDLAEIQSAISARDAAPSVAETRTDDAPSVAETPVDDAPSVAETPTDDAPSGDA